MFKKFIVTKKCDDANPYPEGQLFILRVKIQIVLVLCLKYTCYPFNSVKQYLVVITLASLTKATIPSKHLLCSTG